MRLRRELPRLSDIRSDDFELFGVPRRFDQDADALHRRWQELQRQAHPDRFASEDAAAQRIAMQWSARINEAYRRLKDPLRRAAYLCELNGAPIDAERNTAMPADFLAQQMDWREALEESGSPAALDTLQCTVGAARDEALAACAKLIDEEQDFAGAAGRVRALMFMDRFAQDIDARREEA